MGLSGMLVMRRLESSFRSFSRPMLHAAARVVQEMGKIRAAAFALGLQDIDESVNINAYSETADSMDSDMNENPFSSAGVRRTSSVANREANKDTIASLLASLMEVVRTTVACFFSVDHQRLLSVNSRQVSSHRASAKFRSVNSRS